MSIALRVRTGRRGRLRISVAVLALLMVLLIWIKSHSVLHDIKQRRPVAPTKEPHILLLYSSSTMESSATNSTIATAHFVNPTLDLGTSWRTLTHYLPVSAEAKAKFVQHNEKQKGRLQMPFRHGFASSNEQVWSLFWNEDRCRKRTPECLFFQAMDGCALLYRKCCAEHELLRRTLQWTMRLLDSDAAPLFLMFGTLLSAVRDNGTALIPWETDIDLGILGDNRTLLRDHIALAMKQQQQQQQSEYPHKLLHQQQEGVDDDPPFPCGTRLVVDLCHTDYTDQPHRCSDVHNVFFTNEKVEATAHRLVVPVGSSRTPSSSSSCHGSPLSSSLLFVGPTVELWPYRRSAVQRTVAASRNLRQIGKKHRSLAEGLAERFTNVSEDGALVDAMVTVRRDELVLPVSYLLPLQSCVLWGDDALGLRCPHRSVEFLDAEYHGREQWIRPKTIHWGQGNVPMWNAHV